jgi:hypothetical protein
MPTVTAAVPVSTVAVSTAAVAGGIGLVAGRQDSWGRGGVGV